MKKIVYADLNGNTYVVTPTEGARLAIKVTLADGNQVSTENPSPVDQAYGRWPIEGAIVMWAESEDECVERIARKDVPFGLKYTIVPANAVPVDRTFRNALKPDLTFDVVKAREITKERLRSERAPLLAAQDVAFTQALEKGASTVAIAAEKQRLRDITKLVDNASLETLKALKA